MFLRARLAFVAVLIAVAMVAFVRAQTRPTPLPFAVGPHWNRHRIPGYRHSGGHAGRIRCHSS
jgi:hypothetical protein